MLSKYRYFCQQISTMKSFESFRKNTVGSDAVLRTPYGEFPLLYADWIASGRLYAPIEKRISNDIGPWIGNTHTETSATGTLTTHAYYEAREIIKKHVNANSNDALLTTGFGMTGAINKLQRMLGLKYCGKLRNNSNCLGTAERPVVFISHMEHHSNHTSWYETAADVVVVPPGKNLLVDLNHLEDELKKYKGRVLIGSFSAGSNVTGIQNPIHEMSEIMHRHGGICFADYAATAPYVPINMHPASEAQQLDGIIFSPHKFLGGPGASGVLIFNKNMYHNSAPDNPGGGTVEWTNPWGEYRYIDDIEAREDGGTPGFIQAMRTALSIRLKEQMNTCDIRDAEEALLKRTFQLFDQIDGIHILASEQRNRIGVVSFYHKEIHYNLIVKLLNDRFGIQVRGGCACAGTYGHYLLDVSYEKSRHITELINQGDLSLKPGWVRLSLHPTMTTENIDYIGNALKEIVHNHNSWINDYNYDSHKNEFTHKSGDSVFTNVKDWFKLPQN